MILDLLFRRCNHIVGIVAIVAIKSHSNPWMTYVFSVQRKKSDSYSPVQAVGRRGQDSGRRDAIRNGKVEVRAKHHLRRNEDNQGRSRLVEGRAWQAGDHHRKWEGESDRTQEDVHCQGTRTQNKA